jgi:signal transduction histidine kinase
MTAFAFVLFSFTLNGQDNTIDSLKKVLQIQKEDTGRINTLNKLSYALVFQNDFENSMNYAKQALLLAERKKYEYGVATAHYNIGSSYHIQDSLPQAQKHYSICLKSFLGLGYKKGIADSYYSFAQIFLQLENNAESLDYYYKASGLYEELNDKLYLAYSLQQIGMIYYEMYQNDEEAMKNLIPALKLLENLNEPHAMGLTNLNIGSVLNKQGKYEEARQKILTALKIFTEPKNNPPNWGVPYCYEKMGEIFESEGDTVYREGDIVEAENKFSSAIDQYLNAATLREKNTVRGAIHTYSKLGKIYLKTRDYSKAKEYLDKCLKESEREKTKLYLPDIYKGLSFLDSVNGNFKGAYENFKKYLLYREEIQNEETQKKVIQSRLQNEFDKKEAAAKLAQLETEKEQERKRLGQWRVIVSLGLLILVFLLIMFFQWRGSNQRKRANLLLLQQKEKVESTLSELRSTQSQLIQSEKMASLGELTAGIAHEIQNPLNFVNNFSDVSTELVDEMNEEISKGNLEDAKQIAQDLKQNLEKINHHGKRAGDIVKSMLQHSRSSSGVKEPTDINVLCDEYLRLSYHGLRAKDKSFNATMKTDFDEKIGNINIVPQDIGRVVLNLINNAFYAVDEKKKQISQGNEPTVSVSTKKLGDKIEIKVSDNGNGIPKKVLDKIFQPFFTTKPTGQGTGLGLSLSYDIVKAHGGELKVETKEGEGSEFIIQLPIS